MERRGDRQGMAAVRGREGSEKFDEGAAASEMLARKQEGKKKHSEKKNAVGLCAHL